MVYSHTPGPQRPQRVVKNSVPYLLTLVLGIMIGAAIHIALDATRAGAPLSTAPAARVGASAVQVNALLRHWGTTADMVYASLLKAHPSPADAIIVEVGSADGQQCKDAGTAGFGRVYCFEPSPVNFRRAKGELGRVLDEGHVQLIQKAAYNVSGQTMEFFTTGSVFDHVGGVSAGEKSIGLSDGQMVTVETIALDDFFNASDVIYFAKLDTQGSDGVVLQGMKQLLASHRVRALVFEMWPMAMKRSSSCEEALHLLLDAGYTLYETHLHEGSIKEPLPSAAAKYNHPTSIDELCKWYLDESTGAFGLWTDIFATVDPMLGAFA